MKTIRLGFGLSAAMLASAGAANAQQVLKAVINSYTGYLSFTDPKTGMAGGYAVDALNAIAKDLGMQVQYTSVTTIEQEIAAVNSGQADIIVDPVARISQYFRQVDISDAVMIDSDGDELGFAMKHDVNAAFLAKINAELAKFEADGTLAALRIKWSVHLFGPDLRY